MAKENRILNVLVACEESQTVCTALRERGYRAFSCDILAPSGSHPEWHIQENVLPFLDGDCKFTTMDGAEHEVKGKWDLIVAHPPCTYLTLSGNRWFNEERYGDKARQRKLDRADAAAFFMRFVNADCDHIAIENPIGYMNTYYRQADQIVQPYWFGDPFEKRTCWWLKGLPELTPTNMVEPPPRQVVRSGKTLPRWYSNCGGDRPRARSKTFPGIANAIADQWGGYVNECVSGLRGIADGDESVQRVGA